MHTEPLAERLEILVVEDEPDIADSIAELLNERGHSVAVVGDGDRALRRFSERAFDLLICDVRLPGVDGMAVFDQVKDIRPDTPVILMSAYGTIADAVEAVKRDASHYLGKPFSSEELLAAVDEAALQIVGRRVAATSAETSAVIVGQTPAMVALREFVVTVAESDGPVLITGETGTGKELVARTIHSLSPRAEKPFVAVNCAAFPETLLEAELFGHERGAFTGALQKREGRFRAANGGTMFLDEIGDMVAGAQAKILRVLESGTFEPIGSDESSSVDVRIISATNADLRAESATTFRQDLFYRLKMFHIHVPPLRARRADLPLLVHHFLADVCEEEVPRLTPRAWSALMHYEYPGNVRELRNALGHAVAVSRGEDLDIRHLPAEFRHAGAADAAGDAMVQPLEQAEREFTRDYLVRTLQATNWNKTRAAEILRISRKTLWKRLRDLGIHSKPS